MGFRLRWLNRLAVADALVQANGFCGWLDAQLIFQRTLAGLELRQGSRALTAEGQQAHELAVGVFLPGLEGKPSAGTSNGFFVFPILPKIVASWLKTVETFVCNPSLTT